LRRIQPAALERYCSRILDELKAAASSSGGTPHERYRKAWSILRDRDRDLGWAFDDPKRSTALSHLTAMRRLGLVTEEEFAGFSAGVRNKVLLILASWK